MNKSKHYHVNFGAIMRISVIQVLLACVFTGGSYAADLKGQSVLDKKLTFSVEDKEISLVLAKIEALAEVKFSYLANQIRDDKKISLNVSNQRLEDVIRMIFKPARIQTELVGAKQILLTRMPAIAPLEIKALTAKNAEPVTYIKADVTVAGVVTDEASHEGLPGVSVRLKSKPGAGTVTDENGAFSISAGENETLIFSFTGYSTKEIAVEGRKTINVSLSVDARALNEVVVIGYGSRNKKDLTGAVSDIKADEISKSAALTPELAMQGRLPGVYVTGASGDPNDRPTVRIRGVTTFGNNADPLYIIDGIPVTEFGQGAAYTINGARLSDVRGELNIFSIINPNDIESITVLKDASSAAIYGVRAANGVILITTKRGKEGKPKVEFSSFYGVQNLRKTFDLLNTQQYTQFYNQQVFANNPTLDKTNAGNKSNFLDFFDASSPKYRGNSPTVDWQGALQNKNAVTESYNVGISGGTGFVNYNIGGGYARQDAALKFNTQKRYSFVANSDFKIKPWLEAGETFRTAYTDNFNLRDGFGVNFDFDRYGFAPPWQPLYDATRPDGLAKYDATFSGQATKYNFLGVGQYGYNSQTLNRTLGSAYVTLIPFKGLRIKGTASADYYTGYRKQWFLTNLADYETYDLSQGNTYNERYTNNFNLTKELSANYNTTLGDHSFDFLVNASEQTATFYGGAAGVQNIPYVDPEQFTVTSGDAKTVSGDSWRESWALQGYLGRISYKYKNKYYLDGTLLRNGSSRFAPDYRWGNFPSASAAWRISAEDFMKPLSFISDLKIRGGIGQLGNQDTRAFAFLSTVNRNAGYTTGTSSNGSGTPNTTAVLGDYANPNLTWEKITTQNLGFDAAFFNNAFTMTFEYYNRKTEGILQAVNFPLTAGLNTAPVFNIANVRNQGIELVLGYNNHIGELQYNISANLTTVNNVVESTYSGQPVGNGAAGQYIAPGYSINSIYGYKTDGIFQTKEEVTTWLASHSSPGNTSQLSPGDFRFKDLYSGPNQKGGPDGVVNSNDQTYLGKTIPGYYYGLNLNGAYRNFDLSLLFNGVGDVQRINYEREKGEYMGSVGDNQFTSVLNAWTPTNPSTTMPRAVYGDPSGNTRFSDRWVENADFLRLNNIQFGYSFPKVVLDKIRMSRLRLYLQSSNTFVITKYKGLDPENDTNPAPRVVLVGVNATF